MKKLLTVTFLAILLTGCKKELAKIKGETCWKCHVLGYPNAPNPNDKDYDKTVCGDYPDYPPRFSDDYGNDLNADCTKQ